MTCYDAACIFAALSKLTLEDQGRTVAERQRLSQRDLERALDFLDKACATRRIPRKAIPLDEIREERLLDPLRTNPRFQLLMMDLAFPDDPFDAKPAPEPEAGNRTSPTSQPRENSGGSPAPIAPSRGG